MKSMTQAVSLWTALLLAMLFTAGLAQADNKAYGAREPHSTQAAKDHAPAFELKVTQAGAGKATITSSPSGIDCGGTCRAEFNRKSQITLTATAAAGSTFKRWGGACQGTTPTCTVTLKKAQNVTAIIDRLPITLNVSKTGSGAGTVTSVPASIDCGATCSATYSPKLAAHQNDDARTEGEKDQKRNYQHDDDERHGNPAVFVTLTATPATGSTFDGWTGACQGTATTCTVTLSQARSVNATFSAPAITTYQYDANGNLIQVTDPLGRIRQVQYDVLNQPIRQLGSSAVPWARSTRLMTARGRSLA